MAILVGDLAWPFKGELWCHMASDTPGEAGLEELHRFAASIGLKRAWLHHHPGLPHYDLSPNMRRLALRKGAEAVEDIELVKRCKGKQPNG